MVFDFTQWPEEAVWEAPSAAFLLWVSHDDAWVVFDKRSGQSHVFNDFTRGIFSYFEEEPMSLAEIMTALKSDLEGENVEGLEEKIIDILQSLDRKGLISPI